MTRSRRKVPGRWGAVPARRVLAGLILAALAGVVVGCNRTDPPKVAQNTEQPATPAQPDGQPKPGEAPNLANTDPGLDTLKESESTASRSDPARPGRPADGIPTGDDARRAPKDTPAGTPPPPVDAAPPVVAGLPGPGGPGRGMPGPAAGPVAPSGTTTPAAPSGAGTGLVLRPAAKGGKKEGFVPGGGQPRVEPPADRLAAGRAGDPKPAPNAANAPAAQPPMGEESRQNAEAYGVYRENEFRSPQVVPLSTFSADVNTASYSNVRRMLQEGRLPPKDAVFLAEFVNYFPYDYAKPKPDGEDPVAFALEMGPCPWNRQHRLVRVGVQAKQLDPKEMPPRNLVFLVDTSGSMSPPNRLPLVKQSLGLLIDQLTEKDTVSLVTYAGTAGVALGPTKGSEKETIRRAVDGLGAGGSTNGEGGLRVAYELARQTFIDGGVNRVILCTDGDFNVGVTGKGELVRMIEEQRRSRVFLTILGYGMGNYKDDTLKELANHGNGHHAYIDSLDEAKKVFVDQGGALVCVAKDVKFQVEFNPQKVAAYRLIGYENRLLKDEDFRDDKKDAGDMGSGHQVTVLYEVVPAGVKIDLPGVDPLKYQVPKGPAPGAADEWLTLKMRYKHPEADTSKELSKPLRADGVDKDLSDDFRWAAAVASFGLLLRDSPHKGAMTYAGVLEEAQGCVGADPKGYRKEFLGLVKRAQELSAPKPGAPPRDGN